MYIRKSQRGAVLTDFTAAVVTTVLEIIKDTKVEFPGFPEIALTEKDGAYSLALSIAGTTSILLVVTEEIVVSQVELFRKDESVTQEFFTGIMELIEDLAWWLMFDNLTVGEQPSKYRDKTTLTI